jgi:hypothetical protein
MTWAVRRLCRVIFSFSSRCQNYDETNILWIAFKNRPIARIISRNFTAIQQILVQSEIWQRDVEKQLTLHNLRTDHVMIWSELKYLITVTFGGSVEQPWHGPKVLLQLGQKNTCLCPGRVTDLPRQRAAGFWPGSERSRIKPPVKTRATGMLPGPVVNTT